MRKLSDAAHSSRTITGWLAGRSRYFWLSLAIGVLAAFLALPSFTDPWLSNVGGFLFVAAVVALVVRGAIALGQAFVQGWREPGARRSADSR